METATPLQATPDNGPGSTTPTKLAVNRMSFFKVDPLLGLSRFRISVLRFFYAVIVLLLGVQVWTEIVTHPVAWQPLPAVAFSFWGALSALAILGLVHPLKMLPLLLIQFSYKLIWLIIVAYPLWAANHLVLSQAQGLTKANLIGVVLDLLVIPWGYVFKKYILRSHPERGALNLSQ
ncbi:hypothetical protein Q3A66_19185 [Hymenobacter sp. BT770]|uniref:hypothetical protein n=1 Tax=Hymenobacter sp. BT770 TaxID=2886942 RepID=UPI001D1298AB|nr:hypothetical protein [Hymenobacter sp. BT770]MCC3155242.1 hypothetical protein [Hymenobacter sp. BT770]MDO3417198.1 hypothetical protein [Hymenobacter sp. BT770]